MPITAIPPWIRPAQPAPLYARGLALGLQAAEQQAQAAYRQQALAAEAQQQEQRAQIAREQMAMEQQKIALEQEQQRQTYELGKAEMQRKADLAGRQYAAQQEYQRRVGAGEDAITVLSEMWPMIGGAGPEAAIIRAQQQMAKTAKPPEIFDLGGGTRGVWNPQSGAFQLLKGSPEMTDFQRYMLTDRMQKRADALVAANPDISLTEADPKWNERRKRAWQAGRKSLTDIEGALDKIATGEDLAPAEATQAAPTPAPTGAFRSATLNRNVLPMPASKAQAVAGQLYQTKAGIMQWDGTKFVSPSTTAPEGPAAAPLPPARTNAPAAAHMFTAF